MTMNWECEGCRNVFVEESMIFTSKKALCIGCYEDRNKPKPKKPLPGHIEIFGKKKAEQKPVEDKIPIITT